MDKIEFAHTLTPTPLLPDIEIDGRTAFTPKVEAVSSAIEGLDVVACAKQRTDLQCLAMPSFPVTLKTVKDPEHKYLTGLPPRQQLPCSVLGRPQISSWHTGRPGWLLLYRDRNQEHNGFDW